MKVTDISDIVKQQFSEISLGLFEGSLTINYPEHNDWVNAEGAPMFGLNMINYPESNFEYFFNFFTNLCIRIDIAQLKVMKSLPLLKVEGRILTQAFAAQIKNDVSDIPQKGIFTEYNFIANVFVFLHECGHLNQELKGDNPKEAKHFSEFNADFYALSKILQYYFTMRKVDVRGHMQRMMAFGGEQNIIRCVIAVSLFICFLESLSLRAADEKSDSEDHPAIQRRFCYLFYLIQTQLQENFSYLFQKYPLEDFMVQLFHTMEFIEKSMFEKEKYLFKDLIKNCVPLFPEINAEMKNSEYFQKFNS